MNQHVSKSINKRFCVRALPVEELAIIAEHLDTCSTCLDQFTKTLQSRRGSAPLKFTLAPEFWFRNEHVDYEQLAGLADNKLDATEREVIDIHLKVCGSCREDVRSFMAFREQIQPKVDIPSVPFGRELTHQSYWMSWWHGLVWKPVYVAAIVVMGIALVVGTALLLKRRAENLQAQQVPTPQVSPNSTHDNRAAKLPSPPDTSNDTATDKHSEEAIVVLNDRGGTITVDKAGNVSGLDDVPPPTRDAIAKVLLTEKIEAPAIVKNLAGQESALRGSDKHPFKQLSPTRTVIVSDRPTFKWESVSGASAYRVFVNDPSGQIIARSDELPPARTEWLIPEPLGRGEIYAWTVTAVVDGMERVAPAPSTPEMKFQVLSAANLRQLSQLRRSRSHVALGLFYAKVGLIAEAERELRIVHQDNPRSPIVKKLLGDIQSWNRR
jgi:hypothetical protein